MGAWMSAAAAEAAGDVQLEVVPTTVSGGQAADVLVVLRNRTPTTLRQLRLSAIPPVRLGNDAKVRMLRAGSDHSWVVRIPARVAPGSFVFRVETRGPAGPRSAHATLEVKPPPVAKLSEVATIDAKTTLVSLDSKHPGEIFLLVTNISEQNLRVVKIVPRGPEFVAFEPPKGEALVTPRQTRIFPIEVSAAERVRPGKYLLLFEVHLAWGAKSANRARVVSSHEAQIGVPLEGTVMTALGLPSFLVVPGVLIVLMIAILWGLLGSLRPAGATGTFPFEEKSLRFWLVAISLSIAMALLYPLAPGGHDYLDSYGLADVVTVWFVSLVIGVAAYIVVLVGAHAYARINRWWIERSSFRTTDEPINVLRKVARGPGQLELPRYQFANGGKNYYAYAVESPHEKAAVWLTPPIRIRVNDDVPVADAQALLRQLRAAGGPGELADRLSSHRHSLTIAFDDSGAQRGPFTKARNELPAPDQGRLVQIS
jgi:hypothetical protein